MLTADGVVYFVTVALLHVLGPQPRGMIFCYPPGSLSVSTAALRALFLASLLVVVFTEPNRLKIARLTGFAHVRIQLKELQGISQKEPLDSSSVSCVSSCSASGSSRASAAAAHGPTLVPVPPHEQVSKKWS